MLDVVEVGCDIAEESCNERWEGAVATHRPCLSQTLPVP